MWRHIASNAVTLLLVLMFLAGGVVLWGREEYSAKGPLAEQICLKVDRGSTMRRVSRALEEDGAIRSGTLFRLGADYGDKAESLKAGSYLLPEGASMAEITEIITKGGASTCGTEVVYRIGVTASNVQVRELDPATGKYVETAEFSPGSETPAAFTKARSDAGTRFRVAVAEGVTSWQVIEGLKSVDVLDGASGD
ncbi:MAG TPA: branched-chain alpha-keto acid dehydrogenase subunit E2, partial [Rhodobacteraceae bacterium]|nr:branched-chain alpha-keto acid dehydrogenase subunit E2 [Paracoccaceae bacterium]